MNLTQSTKIGEITRDWYSIDLADQVLGRISSRISQLLMGKSKPYFVSHLDCGDYVVVLNAKKVKVTGKKGKQKIYEHFSGYPGGRSVHTFAKVMEEDPKRIIVEAVSGMLPHNKLRASMLKRLFVFSDEKHPYGMKLNESQSSKGTKLKS